MSVIKVKDNNEFIDIATIQGPIGPQGEQGPAGVGVPADGPVATGTFLAKTGASADATSWQNIFSLIYPVGSIYLSTGSVNPGMFFGGTWEQIQDKFLLAAGSSYSAGDYGGAASHVHTTQGHVLTEYEMPAHGHASYLNSSSGNDKTVRGRVNYTDNSPAGWVDWSYMSTVGGNGSHSHGDTGSGSNMPPYLVVYIWKRIS